LAVRNTGTPPKASPIQAPSTPAPSSSGGASRFSPRAMLASCLGVVVSAVSAAAIGLLMLGLGVRELASNYMPDQFRAWGLGFLAAPPQSADPIKTTEWYSCDAHFERSPISVSLVNYTLHCTAKVPMQVEKLEVAVYSPTEAQLSGDIMGTAGIPIDAKVLIAEPKALKDGDPIDFTGQLRADPTGRPVFDHNRKYVVTGNFTYPDDDAKPDHSAKYELEIRTTEGAFQ
jgi:hypothetical protein